MSSIRFIQGDAQRLPLADRSVQCVVTSPPYWGLRDYGIPPTVWGGSSQCRHEWGEWREQRDVRFEKPIAGKTRTDDRAYGSDSTRRFDGNHQKHSAGQFCQRCAAWRGNLGLEPTPDLFVEHMVEVFREVRRVLRDDGTVWLNLGDSYNAYNGGRGPSSSLSRNVESALPSLPSGHGLSCKGLKQKDLIGIPWRVALALQADGWYLRDCIVWAKPNPMPSSVTDRTTTAHEYVFLLTKKARYFYDADAIREPVTSTGGASFGPQKKHVVSRPDGGHAIVDGGSMVASRKLASPEERNHPLGRNKRSVWTISTQSCKEAHFATYPMRLVEPCILAGTSGKGCCPHCGAPWKRIVDVKYENPGNRTTNGPRSIAMKHQEFGTAGFGQRLERRGSTVGWMPSCKCPAHEPVPCLILDPFNGAATTGLVAWKHGRRYVGIERKAEYIEISRRRLAAYIEKHKDGFKPKRTRELKAGPAEPSLFATEVA